MIDIGRTRVNDSGFTPTEAVPPDKSLEALLLGRPDLKGLVFGRELELGQIDLKLLPNFELRVWWLLLIDKGYDYEEAVLTVRNYYELFASEYEADGTESFYVDGLREFFGRKIDEATNYQSKQAEAIKNEQKKKIALNLVSRQLSYIINNYFFLATSYQEWSNLACAYNYLFEFNISNATQVEKLQASIVDDEGLITKVRDLVNFMKDQDIDRDDFRSSKKSDIAYYSLFGRFIAIWPELNEFMGNKNAKWSKVVYMIKFLLIPNDTINILNKILLLEKIHGLISKDNVQSLDQLDVHLQEVVAIKNLLFFKDGNGSARVEIEGLLYKNGSYKVFKFIL